MKTKFERIKRNVTCDPEKDKNCKCSDRSEVGVNEKGPTFSYKRVCERKIRDDQ